MVKKTVDETVQVTCTPRALVFYHMGGEYSCWQVGLGWFEMHKYEGISPQLKFFHFLYSDITLGAVYHRYPGHDAKFVKPLPKTVITTAAQFEEYLRLKVWHAGCASQEVFKILGLTKPAQAAVAATTETNESLNELYPRVAALMEMPEADVRKRYAHLNPGLQAMNLRNRLRAKGQAV